MLNNNDRTIANLIELTSAGLSVATYPQIRKALATKFKEIYGSDIDLSTTSADGIYLENVSLLINNLLAVIKMLYSELNIDTATGVYLEALCSLSGIYRKPATKSIAVLKLINNNDETIILDSSKKLEFIDGNNISWITKVQVGSQIELIKNEPTEVIVECEKYGPIVAPSGWIDKLISNEYNITIEQENDAEIGSYEENDSHLRLRRNESMSTKGISVLETLAGALLNLSGIDDVKIYNNDTSSTINSADGTQINTHDIYVVIRKKQNVKIDNSTIGSIIYEKLTPGVKTTDTTVTPDSKNHQYTQYILGNSYDNAPTQMIYWKEATPIKNNNLEVEIKLYKQNGFATNSNYTVELILESLKTYLNELPISKKFTDIDLINVVNNADPYFRGQKTYNCQLVSLNHGKLNKSVDNENNIDTYYTKDTFFDISEFNYNVSTNSNIVTITVNKTA